MEENVKFLHNYKFEKKVENEGKENIWINPDLTITERESAFAKKRKAMSNKKKKKRKTKRMYLK